MKAQLCPKKKSFSFVSYMKRTKTKMRSACISLKDRNALMQVHSTDEGMSKIPLCDSRSHGIWTQADVFMNREVGSPFLYYRVCFAFCSVYEIRLLFP